MIKVTPDLLIDPTQLTAICVRSDAEEVRLVLACGTYFDVKIEESCYQDAYALTTALRNANSAKLEKLTDICNNIKELVKKVDDISTFINANAEPLSEIADAVNSLQTQYGS